MWGDSAAGDKLDWCQQCCTVLLIEVASELECRWLTWLKWSVRKEVTKLPSLRETAKISGYHLFWGNMLETTEVFLKSVWRGMSYCSLEAGFKKQAKPPNQTSTDLSDLTVLLTDSSSVKWSFSSKNCLIL